MILNHNSQIVNQMKRILSSLFSLSMSVAAFAGLSYDNAYWIIKDGRISEGINYVPYSDLENKVPSELADTTVDGEPVVVYRQLSANFLDVRLSLETPLDFSKNYVMVFEYKIPASHADTLLMHGERLDHKPLFIFGFVPTATKSDLDRNAPHSDVAVYVDGKWGKTDEWETNVQYMYVPERITTAEAMFFTYAREYIAGDMTEFPYIKNMAIVALDQEKPFYAENFDGFGLGEFYDEKIALKPKKGTRVFNGGVNPVISDADVEYASDQGRPSLVAFRDFIPDSLRGQDGSGYYDCEIQHGLQIETDRQDSVVFPGIAIPEGCSKFYSSMLIKKHKNEKGLWPDADYSEVKDLDVPIKLKFSTGEIVDIADDRITLQWTKFKSSVDVPAGATSMDLIFYPSKMGYLVDEILFSAAEFTNVKDFMAQNHAFEVEAYVDDNGEIVVLNGDLQAIYNLNGRIASEGDKIVVILVKNAEGQFSSKLMLRK